MTFEKIRCVAICALTAVAIAAPHAAFAKPATKETPSDAATPDAIAPPDIARGEVVFQVCASCHEIGPDAVTKIGPPLTDVVGRRIGRGTDFAYSKAIKYAGRRKRRWTAETLDAYLAAPAKFAPGNKMAFAGLRNADDRRDLIAYLASFKTPPPTPAKKSDIRKRGSQLAKTMLRVTR